METVFIGFGIRVWTYAGDPDDDVHTSGGAYADIGEVFWNTSADTFFICLASAGPSSQSWKHYTSGVLQSDWSQGSSGSQDFIKNKPSIPAAQIQSDWTQSNNASLDYIKNKPAARSQSSASRSLNSAFQISSTRDCFANYSVDIATSLTLTTGQAGTVYLEIASDSGFTTNLQELARFVNGNTGTLTIGLSLAQNVTGTLSGYIPSGYYARLRTQNNTSTPTFTYRSGQEVLL